MERPRSAPRPVVALVFSAPGPAEAAALRAFARELLDLLLPPRCAGCGASVGERGPLCAACDASLPRIDPRACPGCQDAAAPAPGTCCAACAAQPSPLDACCAAAWFEGATAGFVRRFKYARPGLAGLDPAAEAVALLLAREAAARVPGPPPDAWVPVPLHPSRLRLRGFAPAAVLARALAAPGPAPAVAALRRVRDTPSQTGLDRLGRQRNVAAAFATARALPGPTVWLVDDVVTTGSTLSEAARALRRAGAREVVGVCLAHRPLVR